MTSTIVSPAMVSQFDGKQWSQFIKFVTNRDSTGLFRQLEPYIPKDLPTCEDLVTEKGQQDWINQCNDIIRILCSGDRYMSTLHALMNGSPSIASGLRDVVNSLQGQLYCVKEYPLTKETYNALYNGKEPAGRYIDSFIGKVYCRLHPKDSHPGFYE